MSVASKGVALVTGAAQGIGKAIAIRLSKGGYNVAVDDVASNSAKLNSVVEEIQSHGRKSCAILADVTAEEEVKGMVAKVVQDLGSLDVMVANAGLCQTFNTVLDTPAEDWDKHFAVNVRGVFLCYKHAGRQMVRQGKGGRIIGASSTAGKQGLSNMATYCTTKFAVRGLTQSLASELGKHKITVNAYAPGSIDTDLIHKVYAGILKANGIPASENTEESDGGMLEQSKTTMGTVEDVASLVAYLASEEAQFLTGQSVAINGGIYFD